jgi:hypothetical protein
VSKQRNQQHDTLATSSSLGRPNRLKECHVDQTCQANMRPKSHCGKLRSDEQSQHEGRVQGLSGQAPQAHGQAGALGKAQLWRAVEASNSSDGRPISLTRTWFSVTPLEAKGTLVAWFYFFLAWQWGHRARRDSSWASFGPFWLVLIRGIRVALCVEIPRRLRDSNV